MNYCNRKGVECDCLSENSVCNSDNCHRKLPDKKLTDSEIIKALECSVKDKCPECPYFHSYPCDKCREMRKDALDLINRQKAEIEKSKNNCDKCAEKTRNCIESLQNIIAEQKAEIERLEKEVKKCKEHYKMACSERNEFLESLETAKAEAYKEFAEMLDNETFGVYYASSLYHVVDIDDVKEILKELVGDK